MDVNPAACFSVSVAPWVAVHLPLHSAQDFSAFLMMKLCSSAPTLGFIFFRLSGMPYESGWLQLCSWWDEVESNHPSRMTADLQSAPLPLTVYHPMFCRQIRIEVGLSLILLCHLSYLKLRFRIGIEPITQICPSKYPTSAMLSA